MAEPTYDLFLVYADDDRAWVEGFLRPALGVPDEDTITREKFRLGAPIVGEYERAVTSSCYTVLVFSPAFLADWWAMFGEQLVAFAAVEEGRAWLVAIVLHPCQLPLSERFRVHLDCTDRTQWDEQVGRLRDRLGRPELPPAEVPCPYPGMVPFTTKDARFFHGREDEIQFLLIHIRNHRFLLVAGPSGSGKSSLVMAGLLPKLDDPEHFPHGMWRALTMRPGDQPFERLRTQLGGEPGRPDATLPALLTTDPPAQRLLLIVDQFEELFTQVKERAEQDRFIAALNALRSDVRCMLIVTMRADFYGDLMNSNLWPVDRYQVLEVAPLRGEALRRAIDRPAGEVGVYLEGDLTERLIADAADAPGSLPMLQEALVLLWGRRNRRVLTRASDEALGRDGRSGLAVAMASKADATLAELTAEQRRIAGRIALRLVQFGEGRPDTRRQQSLTELRAVSDDPHVFDQTLCHLADNRLITLSGEPEDVDKESGVKVDIAHDGLITGWPTLQQWLMERRGAELNRRRLEVMAEEWVRLGRGDGGLLDAVELKEAARWLSSSAAEDLGYDEALSELVRASRTKIEAEQRARRRRVLNIITGLIAGFVLVTVLAVRSEINRREAVAERERAETNFKRARNAVDQMLTQLAAVELVDAPLMESRRKRMLEKALDFYQEFLEEKRDDPSVRQEAGLAYRRRGGIRVELGYYGDDVEQDYRKAINLLEELEAESPAEVTYRSELARSYFDLGVLMKDTYRFRESEADFRDALRLQEQLVKAF